MKAAAIIVMSILGLILIGGSVNVGGGPVFWHIDGLIGSDVLMPVYDYTFGLMLESGRSAKSAVDQTDRNVDDFQERPIGIDNKSKYRRLDEASDY